MRLSDIARRLPEDLWAIFEPILPAVAWAGNGRPPVGNRDCLHAPLYVPASGSAWEALPCGFPSAKTVPRRLKVWLREDAFLAAWRQLAERYEQVRGIPRGPNPPRRLQEAVEKGGEASGPSPVDRGKSGSAIRLASDGRAVPLGVVVTAASANDGCQTHKVRASVVVQPPPEGPAAVPDELHLLAGRRMA
jgi:transposase